MFIQNDNFPIQNVCCGYLKEPSQSDRTKSLEVHSTFNSNEGKTCMYLYIALFEILEGPKY